MRSLLPVTIFLCLAKAAPAAESPAACLARAGAGFRIEEKIKPASLPGDFYRTGAAGLAVVVRRNGAQGIVICRQGAPPDVLGAGTSFHFMKNLDFTAWRIQRAGKPPVVRGDALYIEWESASAIVYWNGRRFAWYQQGD